MCARNASHCQTFNFITCHIFHERCKSIKNIRCLFDEHMAVRQPDNFIATRRKLMQKKINTRHCLAAACRHHKNAATTVLLKKIFLHRNGGFLLVRIQLYILNMRIAKQNGTRLIKRSF